MPAYRIYRLKPRPRQQFLWAPHTSGTTEVKLRDYIEAGSVEAASTYGAWAARQGTDGALELGDLLEATDGKLYICKYVGFEDAKWVVPEAPPASESAAPEDAPSAPSAPLQLG